MTCISSLLRFLQLWQRTCAAVRIEEDRTLTETCHRSHTVMLTMTQEGWSLLWSGMNKSKRLICWVVLIRASGVSVDEAGGREIDWRWRDGFGSRFHWLRFRRIRGLGVGRLGNGRCELPRVNVGEPCSSSSRIFQMKLQDVGR